MLNYYQITRYLSLNTFSHKVLFRALRCLIWVTTTKRWVSEPRFKWSVIPSTLLPARFAPNVQARKHRHRVPDAPPSVMQKTPAANLVIRLVLLRLVVVNLTQRNLNQARLRLANRATRLKVLPLLAHPVTRTAGLNHLHRRRALSRLGRISILTVRRIPVVLPTVT